MSRATGLCLDSNGNGDVYGMGCNKGRYQLWAAERVSGSDYRLRNRQTGRCLSHDDTRGVFTDTCSSDGTQTWTWTGTNAASVWVNHANGQVLDGNSDGHVYTLDSNGGDYQRWRLS